jgi:branched-chain amino acid transport system substrate-binding protein
MVKSLRQPQRLALLLGLIALLCIGSACGDDAEEVGDTDGEALERSPQTPIIIAAGEPIVIGVSTALTGGPVGMRGAEYRDAAVVGVERWKAENGEQIGGHDIEVVAEDDGCTQTDITVAAARRLLKHKGLVGVIGPQCSGGSAAVIPIYAQAGVVAVSGSATKTDLTVDQGEDGFFFRTAYRNDLEGAFAGAFAVQEIQAKTVYLVDDDEPFGIDLAVAAQRVMEADGVEVIRESVAQGTVDFSELAARIAAEAPDLVGFAGFNPEAALFYQQLRDAGYDGLFGGTDAAASQMGFVEPVGEAAEDTLFTGCQYPLPDDVLADFVRLHGDEPQAAWPGQYADAATVLLDAVRMVAAEQEDGSLVVEPEELRDAVRASDLRDGVTGALAFDSNGDRVTEPGDELQELMDAAPAFEAGNVFTLLGLIPCQVQDGKLVPLGGPGAADIRLP